MSRQAPTPRERVFCAGGARSTAAPTGQYERVPDAPKEHHPPPGWLSYRPPPSIATARPTESLELRVSTPPWGADEYELLILDLEEEAGQVSSHPSLEEAQRFASERTGLGDIAWAVVGPEQLTIRPEVGAESPLWTADGEMVPLADLPLDPLFREELQHWAASAWERSDAATRHAARRFRDDLARQLGRGYEIILDEP